MVKNQLADMKKQFEDLSKDITTKIEKGVTDRLVKMGFREEKNLAAPQLKSLGDTSVPIVKSDDSVDTTDELSKLSWGQLRTLQVQVESGNTEGIPQELIKR